MEFYSLDRILKEKADYNIIVGERSNGKSYAVLEYALKDYFESGGKHEFAYIRRWQDDFKGKRGGSIWTPLVDNGLVTKYSGGTWTGVYYYSSRYYFCRYDDHGNRVVADDPFAYAFSISSLEHDKSTSWPRIVNLCFDEFITRGMYIGGDDEFVLFCNVVSTIIRYRKDVKIFMLGNTVNQYCPYFAEMGIQEIKDQKQGTIRVYRYGNSDLKVAVEYCANSSSKKDSNKYFAFNNPKLEMITGGAWEIDLYPHAPVKWKKADVVFSYFIDFVADLVQCDVIQKGDLCFTFIHKKTTEIKDADTALVFCQDYDPRYNWRRNIEVAPDDLGKKILWFFRNDKVFYQDNITGEIVRNYILWAKSEKMKT